MPVDIGGFAKMGWAMSLRDIPPQAKLLAIYFAEVGFNFSFAKAADWTGIPIDQIPRFLSMIPREDFIEIHRDNGRHVIVTWPAV